MKKWIVLPILLLFIATVALAQKTKQPEPPRKGHSIRIKLDNYAEKELYLGYYYGDKQYLRDTAIRNPQGYFVFEKEEELPGGMYLLVMPPNNEYFQMLISPGEQHFTLESDAKNIADKMKVSGSPDNKLLYDYLQFLAQRRPLADTLRARIERSNEAQKNQLQRELDKLNEEVTNFQQKIITQHSHTLTAAIVRANQQLDMPDFEGDEQNVQNQRWRYTQQHFFDNFNLADPRMLRTPFLFERVDFFVNKLQVQHPDTLAKAVDIVLMQMKPAEETFKYYLIHFVNFFAKSNYVGMDAVYVHLVEKYYATGQAPWTDEEQLQKMVENALGLKPTLIGKIAPNIEVQKRDGSKITLHDVKANYTILYIWKYDCGVCKKSTPIIKDFYEKYKDQGVQIFAICYQFGSDATPCWEYVDEAGVQDWIHTVDLQNRSRYRDWYYVRSTPQIYILDSKKEIISKRIGAEQLNDVMETILEMKRSK